MSQQALPEAASVHGLWSSRWVFVLATAGSAIGLGSIWKFPYLAGMHGGGAFVLLYLLCVLLVGLPVMAAEIIIGRRGRASPVNAMRSLARESGLGRSWVLLGWVGSIAAFLILSYYAVIGGWALDYTLQSLRGAFAGATADQVGHAYEGLLADPLRMLLWHTLFMLLTIVVVAQGVQAGLERAVRWLMPALFVLLLVLLGYAMSSGFFMAGVDFLFSADFSRLDGEAVLVALGQAMFSLSLGMATMIAYGAYMSRQQSIGVAVLAITGIDTLVSLVAGLVIFPIVFAHQLAPAAGTGLMFVTLPLAFGGLPLGDVFGALFFGLVVVAAWVSAIALPEPLVAWAVERGTSRRKAAWIVGGAAWALGIVSIMSFNVLSGEEWRVFGKSPYEAIDFLASNLLLPLGALMIAVLVGWKLKETKVMKEFALRNEAVYIAWRIAIRIVAPLAIIVVLLDFLGVLRGG